LTSPRKLGRRQSPAESYWRCSAARSLIRSASGLKGFDLLLNQAVGRAPVGELVDIDADSPCSTIALHFNRKREATQMGTTTIRIEEDLKARLAAAAERSGKTTHAFILDAIAQTVEMTELDEEFHRVADARWAKVLATGRTVPWADARVYLEARARGKRPRAPAARKPAR
jgi:predicted transcriptional regulator